MANNKPQRKFAAADASRKPTLVCTGYVFKVGEGHPSTSGVYNVNPIEIQPFGGGRAITYQFLTRPEWFELDSDGKPSFRPRSLEKADGGKSMLFVYQKMMNGEGTMSALEGLAGTPERLAALEDALTETEGLDGDESANILEGIFKDILLAAPGSDPVEIGYVLKQARNKTGFKNAEGRAEYVLDNKYDLGEFWEVTEKNKKQYRKIAEKSAARTQAKDEPISFKICFDEGVSAPF